MQSVAKWGNSLAVRIPASVIRKLGLKAGDKVDLRAAGDGTRIDISPALTREQAIADIRAMRKVTMPTGWTFDREEAQARGEG